MGQLSSSVRLRSGDSGSCRRRRLLRPGSEPLQVNIVSCMVTHTHTHIYRSQINTVKHCVHCVYDIRCLYIHIQSVRATFSLFSWWKPEIGR